MKALLASVVVFLAASFASAQNAYYPAPYGYYGNGGIYGRAGGALYGSSQVMNAYGNVINDQEQARITRQKYYQEKLNTKKMTFDEILYEKANTPSWGEEQAKIQGQTVQRIMNSPLPAEITSGKAQNIMLPYLQALNAQGIQGPPIPLDPDQLKLINVTTQGKGTNVGLLREAGRLEWPPLLTGPLQKKVDELLPKAVDQLVKGQLDPKLYGQLNKTVQELQEDWRKKLHKEEIDGGTYINGKHYLDALESSVVALVQPGTRSLLAGVDVARSRDVHDLVYNMVSRGLQFAPAVPGNEVAYFALQDAMVAYARGAQGTGGFQARYSSPSGAPQQGPP